MSARLESYSRTNFIAFVLACVSNLATVVFLGATQSFFLTEALGRSESVGKYVGRLTFYDQIVVVLLTPFVGVLCDRVGSRYLESGGLLVMGMALIGTSLLAGHFWSLVFWRLIFAAGAASAMSVMGVMLIEFNNSNIRLDLKRRVETDEELHLRDSPADASFDELDHMNAKRKVGKQTAILGIASGFGAVFAVVFLLRLPVMFDKSLDGAGAIRMSYLTVGVGAILMSVVMFYGLYKDESLAGDIPRLEMDEDEDYDNLPIGKMTYLQSMKHGFKLGLDNPMLLLAYAASIMGRLVTITVTLFIPFYINHYFLKTGKCDAADDERCRDAYILSSILTGLSNLMTLISAPIIGKLIDVSSGFVKNLVVANILCFASFFGFVFVRDPPESILALSVLSSCTGVAGMSFIIISMTMLSNITSQKNYFAFKGCIMGVSSLAAEIGVMFMTLVAGALADKLSAAPFLLISLTSVVFTVILLVLKKVNAKPFEL